MPTSVTTIEFYEIECEGNIDKIVWENGKQMFISYSIHYVKVPVVFIFEYFQKGFYYEILEKKGSRIEC